MKNVVFFSTLLASLLGLMIVGCGKNNKTAGSTTNYPQGTNPITNWGNRNPTGASVNNFLGLQNAVNAGQFASEEYPREGFNVISYHYDTDASCDFLFWDFDCTKIRQGDTTGFRYGIAGSAEAGHEIFGNGKNAIRDGLIAILAGTSPNAIRQIDGVSYPGYQAISGSVHRVISGEKIYEIDLSRPIAANPTFIYEIDTGVIYEVSQGFPY